MAQFGYANGYGTGAVGGFFVRWRLGDRPSRYRTGRVPRSAGQPTSQGRGYVRYAAQTNSESPDLGPRQSQHARRSVARLGTSPLRGLLPVMGMSEIGLRRCALFFLRVRCCATTAFREREKDPPAFAGGFPAPATLGVVGTQEFLPRA